MKKLLLVLAIGAFVACNDNAGTNDTQADSSVAPSTVDTNTVAPMDTTNNADTTTAPSDTTIKK